jgi:hypothetical protein
MSSAAIDRALVRIDEFPAVVGTFVQLVDVVAMKTKQCRDDLERATLILDAWVQANKDAPNPLCDRTVACLNEIGKRDPSG